MGVSTDRVEGIGPLVERARQLQAIARQERDSNLKRWQQSEKPVLKDHAIGLKDRLKVLSKEEAKVQSQIQKLSTSSVKNNPGTATGFNIIRSKVDRLGRPLPTESLRAERESLIQRFNKVEVAISNAKAEIVGPHRDEENDILETKLVALQDTKRAFLDEINAIEVELLGREHYERVQRERQLAEESGVAQLRRLQEQVFQTRIKYNRVKQQYYFPFLKGFHIAFGGAGIYGACKDICICDIKGSFLVRIEPGGIGNDGSYHSARMIVEVQGPIGGSEALSTYNQERQRNGDSHQQTPSGVLNSDKNTGSDVLLGLGKSRSTRDHPNQYFSEQRNRQPSSDLGLKPNTGQASQGVTVHSGDTVRTLELTTKYDQPSQKTAEVKQPRLRNLASRFLNRLNNRKDRYQGKELPHLQPIRDDDVVSSSGKARRSLASKLFSRRRFKGTSGSEVDSISYVNDDYQVDNAKSVSEQSIDTGSVVEEGIDLDEVTTEEAIPEAAIYDQIQTNSAMQINKGDGEFSFANEDDDGASDVPEVDDDMMAAWRHDTITSFATLSTKSGRSLNSLGEDATNEMSADEEFYGEMENSSQGERDGASKFPAGVYVKGRLSGFQLVGERGSNVPNLTIGNADVSATVYARFVFEYSKTTGWRRGTQPQDRPIFHVDNLAYKLRGNNVPMPPTLIKHILRIAIPGLIQRRLLGLLPKEFGDYLLATTKGLCVKGDVIVKGPALDVMDANIAFEVLGPADTARDARKQQAYYAAAKEARSLLGLSLPQAQILAELFAGPNALLDNSHFPSISGMMAFQAAYERYPKIYNTLCRMFDAGYQLLAQARQSRSDILNFSFTDFMSGPITRLRRKPARMRIVLHEMDVAVSTDALVTAIHDFIQRTIEEILYKGPLSDSEPGVSKLEAVKKSVDGDLDVLHAWHAFVQKELQHFKSKFHGASGTVILAADHHGFSAGCEDSYYEGPLRVRLPLSVRTDQDGSFSFEVPLPTPQGKLGIFMDNFKGLLVPSHLRPPAQAVNWVELSHDSEVDQRMRKQISTAIGLIQEVLTELQSKVAKNRLELDDCEPHLALSQPRTTIGDRLGKMFVNRLKLKVKLDERKIGEILSGIDPSSLGGGEAFAATAGRIIGHLGDVMSFGLTPAQSSVRTAAGSAAAQDRYLFHFETTDISRLRAEIKSLGFKSAVTPGGAVRLVHAIGRAAMLAFLDKGFDEVDAFREQMKAWYGFLTRETLRVSVNMGTKGQVEDGAFVVQLHGRADGKALLTTSPLVITNEINLVQLGKAMRGDVDTTFPVVYKE